MRLSGGASDPTWESYNAPSDLLPVFRGPTSKGMGEEKRAGKGDRRDGRREEKSGGEDGSSSFALGRKTKSRRLRFGRSLATARMTDGGVAS